MYELFLKKKAALKKVNLTRCLFKELKLAIQVCWCH